MIIYLSILTIVSVLMVNTVLMFTGSYRNLQAMRIVEHSATDAMERMTRDIRTASSVDQVHSTFGSNSGILTLVTTLNGVSTTTKYYLQNNIIQMNVNGAYWGPLSSSNATVISLVFSISTSSVSEAVKIDMTVQGVSGNVTKNGVYHSTVVLRGQ